jgi:hypothetical protein
MDKLMFHSFLTRLIAVDGLMTSVLNVFGTAP